MYLLNFFDLYQFRRLSVLRQILTNKKTSSVMYWGFRYGYIKYLNMCPKLNFVNFNKRISYLLNQDLLFNSNGLYKLTFKGYNNLLKFNIKHYFFKYPALFGFYNVELWDSIIRIAVQVASEYSYSNNKYLVISDNLYSQSIIKNWIYKYGFDSLRKNLIEFLKNFLINKSAVKANIFVSKLVGHQFDGYTNSQLSIRFHMTPTDVEIIWKDLILQFAEYIRHKGNSLSKLVDKVYNDNRLSTSVLKTRNLFFKNYSIDQIAKIRHLKSSTIEEHIQILAIFDNHFDYNRIISPIDISLMRDIYNGIPIDEWNFELIKNKLDNFSFLKYRIYAIKKTHEEYNK